MITAYFFYCVSDAPEIYIVWMSY